MKPPASDCPSDETLASLLDETVGSHEFDDHILHCQTCRSRLDQLSGSELLGSYRQHSPSYSFLEKPLRGGDLGSIGEMHIEKEIGRGAMGVVFRAHDQILNRAIAVKVLTGDANQRSTGRFDRESRAAAGLKHDHLVPVHSVGHTNDGRPYLVMPLVRGKTLKEYLADGPLDARNAATFIFQIAQGLSAVHDNGLVHRDVKSANILIDSEDDRAKLTDFGLARADVDATLTQANAICGTPEYMSPEQATGSAETPPTSDIYSLGVTLYESLTGTTPFRGSPIQIMDQHRQAEPVPPSRLNAQTPRDLETICLKALSKDPSRRYPSASEMADDLRRYMDGLPIQAQPVSTLETTWMWCKRNQALAASLLLLVSSLVLGSIVSTGMWLRSERSAAAERKANEQSRKRLAQVEKGNEILGSIFEDLNVQSVREDGQPVEAAIAERLVAAAEQLDSEALGDPLVMAKLQNQLGNSLISLGFASEAATLIESSLESRRDGLGADDPITLDTSNSLAVAWQRAGKFDEAIALLEDVLERQRVVLGENDADTLRSLGNLARCKLAIGAREAAIEMFEKVIEQRKSHFGDDSATLTAMGDLAEAYIDDGRFSDALPLYEHVYERQATALGPDHPDTVGSLGDLATGYRAIGEYQKALAMCQEAAQRTTARFGRKHPEAIITLQNLAVAHLDVGDFDEAARLDKEALKLQTEKLGPDHPSRLVTLSNIVVSYWKLGRIEEAIEFAQEAATRTDSVLGRDHPSTLRALNNLATVLEEARRFDEAESTYRDVLERKREQLGAVHPSTVATINNLGTMYFKVGRFDKSTQYHGEALAIRRKELGIEHPHTLLAMYNVASGYRKLGEYDQSLRQFKEALEITKKALGPNHTDVPEIEAKIGLVLNESGQFKEAIPHLKAAYRCVEQVPFLVSSAVHLFDAYVATDQIADAEQVFETGLRDSRKVRKPNSLHLASDLAGYGEVLLKTERFSEAEKLLRESHSIQQEQLPESWKTFKTQSLLGAAIAGQQITEEAILILTSAHEKLLSVADSIPHNHRDDVVDAAKQRCDAYAADLVVDDERL